MKTAPLLSAAAIKKLDTAMKLLQEVIEEANPHMAATTRRRRKRKRLADLFATREKLTAQVDKTSKAADARAHRLGAAAATKRSKASTAQEEKGLKQARYRPNCPARGSGRPMTRWTLPTSPAPLGARVPRCQPAVG